MIVIVIAIITIIIIPGADRVPPGLDSRPRLADT